MLLGHQLLLNWSCERQSTSQHSTACKNENKQCGQACFYGDADACAKGCRLQQIDQAACNTYNLPYGNQGSVADAVKQAAESCKNVGGNYQLSGQKAGQCLCSDGGPMVNWSCDRQSATPTPRPNSSSAPVIPATATPRATRASQSTPTPVPPTAARGGYNNTGYDWCFPGYTSVPSDDYCWKGEENEGCLFHPDYDMCLNPNLVRKRCLVPGEPASCWVGRESDVCTIEANKTKKICTTREDSPKGDTTPEDTTQATACPAPLGLEASASGRDVTITWAAPTKDTNPYFEVYFSTLMQDNQLLTRTSGTTFVHNNAPRGAITYQVRNNCEGGTYSSYISKNITINPNQQSQNPINPANPSTPESTPFPPMDTRSGQITEPTRGSLYCSLPVYVAGNECGYYTSKKNCSGGSCTFELCAPIPNSPTGAEKCLNVKGPLYAVSSQSQTQSSTAGTVKPCGTFDIICRLTRKSVASDIAERPKGKSCGFLGLLCLFR